MKKLEYDILKQKLNETLDAIWTVFGEKAQLEFRTNNHDKPKTWVGDSRGIRFNATSIIQEAVNERAKGQTFTVFDIKDGIKRRDLPLKVKKMACRNATVYLLKMGRAGSLTVQRTIDRGLRKINEYVRN